MGQFFGESHVTNVRRLDYLEQLHKKGAMEKTVLCVEDLNVEVVKEHLPESVHPVFLVIDQPIHSQSPCIQLDNNDSLESRVEDMLIKI